VPFLGGLAGGVVIAIASVLVEHSRIELGRFALYGNGALVVPAIGVTLALYAGWTGLARGRAGSARLAALALCTLGLLLGVGFVSPLDAVFYPASPDATLAGAIPGLLFTGLIFVIVPAIVAAGLWWIYTKIPVNAATLAVGYLIGMPFALVLGPIAMGTIAGTAVAHGTGAATTARGRVAIGALALALTLVAAFVVPVLVLG
jgi:hypothetical protein